MLYICLPIDMTFSINIMDAAKEVIFTGKRKERRGGRPEEKK